MIKSFIQTAENLFAAKGYKAAILRTDNGGEFCNDEMNAYCAEKGITHQITVPYNSSQNGVVERKHRTIQEKVRTLLFSSGLPENFWSGAVKTAEYLINRYPADNLKGQSPFERWYGYKPNYDIIHPFGASCYVLVPPEKRTSAFSPVSVSGILVGFSSVHKAYRCFIPSLKDVVISNNVKFNDKLFPYKRFENLPIPNKLPPSDVNFGAKTGGAVFPLAVDISIMDTDSSYVPSDEPNTTSKSTRWNISQLRSSPSITSVHSSSIELTNADSQVNKSTDPVSDARIAASEMNTSHQTNANTYQNDDDAMLKDMQDGDSFIGDISGVPSTIPSDNVSSVDSPKFPSVAVPSVAAPSVVLFPLLMFPLLLIHLFMFHLLLILHLWSLMVLHLLITLVLNFFLLF